MVYNYERLSISTSEVYVKESWLTLKGDGYHQRPHAYEPRHAHLSPQEECHTEHSERSYPQIVDVKEAELEPVQVTRHQVDDLSRGDFR